MTHRLQVERDLDLHQKLESVQDPEVDLALRPERDWGQLREVENPKPGQSRLRLSLPHQNLVRRLNHPSPVHRLDKSRLQGRRGRKKCRAHSDGVT